MNTPATHPGYAPRTPSPRAPRIGPRSRHQALITLIVLITVGVVALVGVNALQLSPVTEQIEATQSTATSLTNANRSALLLVQRITELSDGQGDIRQVEVQRGLLLRHLQVSERAFGADSPQGRELRRIMEGLRAYPWERAGDSDAQRLEAIAQSGEIELQVNAVRSAEEQQFYRTMADTLEANRNSQLGLAALMALLVVLGIAALVRLSRRSRVDVDEAYAALQEEFRERRAAEEALRTSEARYRSLVQSASDLTVITDETGVISYISPVAENLVGRKPDDLRGVPLVTLVGRADREQLTEEITQLYGRPGTVRTVELRLISRSGGIRLVEAVCQNLVHEPGVGGLLWNGRDMTARRSLEDELIRQAHYDPLTGLPNRALLMERLRVAASRPAGSLAVLLVDLDGFKNVNDSLGHPAGDELLRAAGQRLRACVRSDDTTARLGGDEFAVIAVTTAREQAIAAGRRIVQALDRPFAVAGQEVRISASIGLVERTKGATAEDLLRDADIAMYVAKNGGKGRLAVFEPDMRSRATQRTGMQQELARAVELGRIEVLYQPVIDLRTMRLTMLEALARWRRADGTVETAGVFIPVAEETGAIIEIGRAVLHAACHATTVWRDLPGHANLGISVNVSVRQVLSGMLYDHVVGALRESGLPPRALTLEITESTALENSGEVAGELSRLRRMGVRIAVDDFGAGYSSLGFLMGLEADILKIDRSLLEFDTTRRGSMVAAVAELGRTLALTVVVEGVETVDHLERAREAGCDAAQGYHFAQPLPASAVRDFLRSRRPEDGAAAEVDAAESELGLTALQRAALELTGVERTDGLWLGRLLPHSTDTHRSDAGGA